VSCNPTRILLSNSGTTTMNVTLTPDPGGTPTVTFQVDGLSITESETASSGTATFSIPQVVATNNSIWDATLQVDSNTPVEASIQVVESNGSQTIGVTLSSTDVTYCSPLAGGSGTVTSVTGTTPISVATGTTTPVVSLDAAGVTAAKIADAAVTTAKVADGAVTNGKIADLTIQHGKIADGAIVTSKIADDAVTADKIADGVINDGTVTSITAGSGLTGGTITDSGTIAHAAGSFIGSEEYPVKIVLDAFGHVQVNESETTAAAYRTAVGSDDAANLTTGTLPAARIAADAITSTKIADDAVTAAKLADTTVTPGAYTAADITVDAQGRLTAATSGSGGGGTDYTMAPITGTWRYFDDFLSVTPDRGPGDGNNQFWMLSGGSGLTPAESLITGGVGVGNHPIYGNNRRYTYWGAMFLNGATASDGDELFWEARAYMEDPNSGVDGVFVLGVIDQQSTLNYNDSPPNGGGYTVFDFAAISFNLTETNLHTSFKDNDGAGGGSNDDLGSSYPRSSYVGAWFRFGIHVKYNAGNSNWDITYYINGSSVATDTMTFSSAIVPYVGGAGSDTANFAYNIDWISYQGKIGAPVSGRTTRLDIDDV